MNELQAHRAELRGAGPLPGPYRDYPRWVEAWCALAERGARSSCVGRTVRGAPLFSLEVGPEDAGRVSVVLAGIHAMEWIGVEVLHALLERLVDSPPEDRRVIAFPLLNVDGFRGVEADLRRGRRRFRRADANGVDLNRNWPTHFSRSCPGGRLLPFLGGPGRRARSEPEVDAVLRVLDGVAARATIDVALSLHSFGRKLLYPYGGKWRPPAAVERLRAAAEAVRDRIRDRYDPVQVSHWVPGVITYGMEFDHLHQAYGATALLVECSSGGASLRRPSSLISPHQWFNPPDPAPVVSDLAPALEPFVRGCLHATT